MKKMLPWLITTLLAISLIAVVAVILYNSLLKEPATASGGDAAKTTAAAAKVKPLTADERVEVTSELKDIKRNLKDGNKFLLVSFAFQLDKKATKEDFDKIKDIVVKPIINRTLADTEAQALQGSAGQDALEAKLLNQINEVLPKGKLIKVSITDYTLTEI
ncbi:MULTISPECIES: flagellar basal body-associated FliL family protein [Paenibacillus]|uniref:flagellar basal body-associated FliL family protein n=1 Tax=Paenibacillus TaxID=44249 RepID=UPI00038F71D9|nr:MULTISPECIES: flagellar basal body-associated FliL family protein [Paenibacillus]KKC46759.1 flagellar basal body protein FliL [Paenibacillus sp. D9]CDN42527.1 Flagellar basal body-associated protein FliL [Paenibacillus sp. P22]